MSIMSDETADQNSRIVISKSPPDLEPAFHTCAHSNFSLITCMDTRQWLQVTQGRKLLVDLQHR